MTTPERAKKILLKLKKMYPQAKCGLSYHSPLQLTVATILSAQCTDKRVNLVTKELFKKYKKAKDFASEKQAVLAKAIRSTGFHQNKSKNIIQCCKELVENYQGKVPKTMAELTKLAGVGRKTANVILGNAFKIAEGIAVDTHVLRISKKLGLTKYQDPVKVEKDLIKLFSNKEWTMLSHYIITHGRNTCKARNPLCNKCGLFELCPTQK